MVKRKNNFNTNYDPWTVEEIDAVLTGIEIQFEQNKNLSAADRREFNKLRNNLLKRRERLVGYEQSKAEKEYLTKAEKKRKAYLAQRDFNKGIGNYQARDYTSQITSWTASQVIRKPYTPSGVRMEFVSRGYTGPSGFPELWNTWESTTGSTTRGRVKGNLSIGSRKTTKGGLTPSIVPNLDFILSNPANSGIGKGQVIMPVGMMKVKKRGGRFNVYP